MTIDPVIEFGDLWRAERLKTKRMLTSSEKYYLLKHPFVLNKMFKFPVQKFGDHNSPPPPLSQFFFVLQIYALSKLT